MVSIEKSHENMDLMIGSDGDLDSIDRALSLEAAAMNSVLVLLRSANDILAPKSITASEPTPEDSNALSGG